MDFPEAEGFPEGSIWYPDGYYENREQANKPKYNPVNDAYTLRNVDKDALKEREIDKERGNEGYTVGVYDARNLKTPPQTFLFL
jgi:hypothetical protein